MNFIEALPKDDFGQIILSPAGQGSSGRYIDGTSSPIWFENNFPELANAQVPLSDEQYVNLKSIDRFWAMNAEQWRGEGII